MHAPELPPHGQLVRLRPLFARMRASQGVRAGAVLSLATLVLNGSAALYNVACIRYLGSRVYGDVAAMLALFAVISLPLGSIQSLLAREAAQLPSVGAVGGLLHRWTGLAVGFAFGIVLLGAALVQPIRDFLNIDSSAIVLAGISALFFAVIAAVLYGFLQGALRFGALSATYSVSGVARPVFVVPALLFGFGATGALMVNTLAGFLAVGIAVFALRDLWRTEAREKTPSLDRRQMAVLLLGSLAFVSLTNMDVLLAVHFLPGDLAGVYAAASLVGKAVLFLPAAVVTVLLPKAATRAAAGRTSRSILFASVGVTLMLTLLATMLLALVPESLLVWAFGGDFRESTALLGWFGLAMTACALINVYLSVYFAERNARFPLIVLGAAVAQIVGVSLWHPNPRSIVMVTLACASVVLLIHEIAFPYALARVWNRQRAAEAVAGSD